MGCKQSAITMPGEDTDASRMLKSLADNEKKTLTTTWKYVRKDHRRHGTLIFVRLFRKHKHYRRYFQDEPGVLMTALASDEHVQSHCVAFMRAMTELVKALTSPTGLDLNGLVQYIAFKHKDMLLTRIDFDNFSVVFLDYLRSEQSLCVSDEDLKVWDRVMNLFSQDICGRMDGIKTQGSLTSLEIRKRLTSGSPGLSCISGRDSSSDSSEDVLSSRLLKTPDPPIHQMLPEGSSMQLGDHRSDDAAANEYRPLGTPIPGKNIDDIKVPIPKGFEYNPPPTAPAKTVAFDRVMTVYPPHEYEPHKDRARARRRRWNAMCSSGWDRGQLPPDVYMELANFDDDLKPVRRKSKGSLVDTRSTSSSIKLVTLSTKERKYVQDLWSILRHDARGSGVKVFLTMFEMYPETQEKFPKLRGRSVLDLKNDRPMQRHAEMVMRALSSLIDNLADTVMIEQMLKSLGKSHCAIHISKDDFLKMKVVMIYVARETLGKEWNSHLEHSWRKAIDILYGELFPYLKGPDATFKEAPEPPYGH